MSEMRKRTLSPRIKILLKNRRKAVKASEIPVRDQAYLDMAEKYKDESVKIQFAHGFAETLRRKSILIQPEDLLAGFIYQYTYNVNFPMKTSADFNPSKRASLKMDVHREVKETIQLLQFSDKSPETEDLKEFEKDVSVWLYKHWHSGHTLAGYDQLLKYGFSGLLKKVSEAEEAAKMRSGEEKAKQKDTLRAFTIVLQACESYIFRYEKEALRMAELATEKEMKQRMFRIATAVKHIKTEAPVTFFEAIQLVSLAHEMMYCENVPSAVSIGRLDYYLAPFYETDRKAGKITYEEAGELIDAFFVKCSSQMKAYQNLTLGGCDQDGKCIINDLTFLCLEASKNLRLDQPSVNFRWTGDMPEGTWRAILNLIRTGMGFPAIFYDPCVIKARKSCEIPEKESSEYAFIGCVEPANPGKEHALTEMVRLNLPKLLNLMLMHGIDAETGQSIRLRRDWDLDEITSFEQLYLGFLSEIDERIDHAVRCSLLLEKMYEKKYPLPYLSVLTLDCITKGKDVTEGGARYNSIGFNLAGIATMADSLVALKTIVFEEKLVSLSEYVRNMGRGFEESMDIRRYLKRKCERFGNDKGEPEKITADILNHIEKRLLQYRTYHNGRFRLGLYTVEDHAIMGEVTGATADGRKAGEALSNSMGASQGMDQDGPTALLNSVTCFPMERATNGMVLDVKLTPSFLETETGQEALKNLICTYFSKGGMEIQISVVSRETLLAARKEPEKYENLIVRVSGFSAYFLTLRKATQDEIIRRTEYGSQVTHAALPI